MHILTIFFIIEVKKFPIWPYLFILWFWIGQKFGFDARNATVTDEHGSQIDSIDVIRDNDKLFIAEDPNSVM